MAKGQTVDQRIVEMKFDNADFESKVGQTLKTLTDLREKTKMEDAGKGMDNLAKSVKQVDLSRLADGIDQLNQRFSAFGIMGQQVIRNLTDAAMQMGLNMANAVMQAPKDGWQEYELNLDSVKNILNSAKGKDGLPVTLDLVNEKLAELNRYSDQTIYSFSDMTSNIGKFTNAGVDLESAVTAIQGVANVAALSGANANDAARAMYNFGQALGAGSVKLIDWKSIQNANMATVDFKNQLIQTAAELGVIRKEGDKWISSTYTGKKATEEAFTATSNFEDSLKQEWMTTEVLTKTLAKYTDKTTDLGKAAFEAATKVTTFSKLIETTKEAMGSGWMNIWQYIFGDYEEASKLWTDVSNVLNDAINAFFDPLIGHEDAGGKWIKGILEEWHDLGGRNDLIMGFKNLYAAAKQFLSPVKDLIAGLFPKVTADTLLTFTKDFRLFAEQLAGPFKVVEEKVDDVKEAVETVSKPVQNVTQDAEKFKQIMQEIIAGKWGDGQERIDKLTEAGYAFENLQNGVNETLGSTKRYETVMSDAEAVGEKLLENTEEQAEQQKNYREEIKKSTDEIFVHKGAVENIAYIFLGVSSAAKLVVAVIDKGVESFKKLSGGVHPVSAALGLLLDILGNLGRHMYNLNTWLIKFGSFEETVEGVTKALGGLGKSGDKNLGGIAGNVSKISKLVTSLGKGFAYAKDKVSGFIADVKNFVEANNGIAGIRDRLFAIREVVAGVLLLAFNSLAGVINTAVDAASNMWAKFKELDTIKALKAAYDEAKDAILGFWDSLSEGVHGGNKNFDALHELSVVFGSIARTVGKLVTMAFTFLGNRLEDIDKLIQLIKNKLAEQGVLDTVINIWSKFKGVFTDLPTIIDNFFRSLQNGKIPTLSELSGNLKGFADSLEELKNKLKTGLGNVWIDLTEKLGENIAKLTHLEMPEKLQEIVNKIKTAFDSFGGITLDAGQKVEDFIKNVIDVFQQVDIGSLAKTGLIGAIGLFVLRWSKVGKNASNAFKSLSTFLQNGGKAAVDIKEKYNGFLKIGAAIALIAAAIWVMAQIPAEQAKQNAIILGVGFVAMFTAIEVLTHQKIDDSRLKAIGIAFAGIGASVVLLAAAVKAFADLAKDPVGFVAGTVAVAVAIAGMVAAIKITGPVAEGAGKAFAGLAAGVLILAAAVKAFSMMKVSTLVKGGLVVTYFVLLMVGAMHIAGEANADGFSDLAKAVLILAGAVRILGGMKTNKLAKGTVVVAALVLAMALASRAAKDVDGEAFKAMGQAIKILATAMFVLSKIPTAKLIVVTASLAVIFVILSKAIQTLRDMEPKDAGKVALALVALLAPIGVCLWLLTSLPKADMILPIAVGLAAIFWGLAKIGPAIEALSKIDFVSGLKAVGILDVMFTSIAAIVLAFIGVLGYIEEAGGGTMLVEGARLLGRMVHALLEGLIFGETDPSTVLESIGNALNSFGTKIMGFLEALKNVDGSVAENAKNLATAILAICAAEVLEALTGFIAGKSNFRDFGAAIQGVTDAVLAINEAVSGDKTFDSKAVNKVITCVRGLVDIANELPKQGGWLQKVLGHQDLGEFATQMATFINGGFRTFLSSVNLLGDAIDVVFVARVALLKKATKALIDLANDLPRQGGIFQNWFVGKQDLGVFATQMANFMNNGFKDFVDALNLLPTVDVVKIDTQLIPATESLIKLSKKLPKESILDSIFDGKQDLGKFATKMGEFMRNGFIFFAVSLNLIPNIDLNKLDGEVIPATEKMLELGGKLKEGGSILSFITGRTDMGIFGANLADFGKGIAEFANSITAISLDDINLIMEPLERLAKLNASEDILGNGFGVFVEGLNKLSTGLTNFVTNSSGASSDTIKTLIDDLTNLHNMLVLFAETDYSGVTNFTVAVDSVATVASEISASLVDNVISGIEAKSSDLTASGLASAAAWGDGFIGLHTFGYGIQFINRVLGPINGTETYLNLTQSGTSAAEAWGKAFVTPLSVVLYGAAFALRVLGGIEGKKPDFKTKGGEAALEFCVGLTVKYSGMIKGAGEKVVKIAVGAINAKLSDFKTAGENAAEGFADGIDEKAWMAEKASEKMAQKAIDKAKETIDSASPSKVFRQIGAWGGEGFALGFIDTIPNVENAVSKNGNAGIFAMRDTIEKMNSMIDENVDYQPTITPVIDLSQFSSGMNTTKSLLGELNNPKTGLQAAVDISTAHNKALAESKARANRDYGGAFGELIENTRRLVDEAKKNKPAVIDGDYLFGYVDRRMGMA